MKDQRKPTNVYFFRPVGQPGPVKIGYSCQAKDRLATYQIWSPVVLEMAAILPGGKVIEGRLHARFAADHMHHEWFRWSPDLEATIAEINDGTFDVDSLPPPLWNFKPEPAARRVRSLENYDAVMARRECR